MFVRNTRTALVWPIHRKRLMDMIDRFRNCWASLGHVVPLISNCNPIIGRGSQGFAQNLNFDWSWYPDLNSTMEFPRMVDPGVTLLPS